MISSDSVFQAGSLKGSSMENGEHYYVDFMIYTMSQNFKILHSTILTELTKKKTKELYFTFLLKLTKDKIMGIMDLARDTPTSAWQNIHQNSARLHFAELDDLFLW